MLLADSIQLSDAERTPQGFIVAPARLARSGIQIYRAGDPTVRQAFPDRSATDEIRVYRPPDEVFDQASLDSLKGMPVTVTHPNEFVNAGNAKQTVVGFVSDIVERDGDHVASMVRLTHEDGVRAFESGMRELSVGYDLELDLTPGTTPDGQAYDAVQRKIRGNHVALVDRGRCGPSCRMHDGANSATDCNCSGESMDTRTIDHEGIRIEMPVQAADAFEALQRKHATQLESASKDSADKDAKIKDLEERLAKSEAKGKDAETRLADAEAKLKPEALDAAAKDRQELIDAAHKIAPDLDCSSLDSVGIRRAALDAIDVDTEGESDDFVRASFDAHAKIAGERTGQAADVAKKLAGATASDENDDPRQKAIDAMENAWRGGKES